MRPLIFDRVVGKQESCDVTTYVYRLIGTGDEVLYVGMTQYLDRRLVEHRHDKPWWPEVQQVTAVAYGNRRLASTAEVDAIRALIPKYNRRNNDSVPGGGTTCATCGFLRSQRGFCACTF